MKKNSSKKRVPANLILPTLCLIGGLLLIVGAVRQLSAFFQTTTYFQVKRIMVEPQITSLQEKQLVFLKGRNIFSVDLKKLHRQLQAQYPRISQLRVVKKMPDQIVIRGKERIPVAQVVAFHRFFLIDREGMILESLRGRQAGLPAISGIRFEKKQIPVGAKISQRALEMAFRVLVATRRNKELVQYPISTIDVSNFSKIQFSILDDVKVILDDENISQKLDLLGVLIAQAKLNLKEIAYIDLRFQEPVFKKR